MFQILKTNLNAYKLSVKHWKPDRDVIKSQPCESFEVIQASIILRKSKTCRDVIQSVSDRIFFEQYSISPKFYEQLLRYRSEKFGTKFLERTALKYSNQNKCPKVTVL